MTSDINFNCQTKGVRRYDKTTLLFFSLLLVYLLVRLFVWQKTVLLEDTDSLFYINNIKAYLSFSADKINNLNPDSTPFYPFFSALCVLSGWSLETAARLCSLIFSIILFIAVFAIAKRTTERLGTALSLLILSFNAALISLSISVLTEPSYIATVYLGFWLFLSQYQNPGLWKGGLLGVIFALSFLNRTEGLFYLAVIPFLQGLHLVFGKNKVYRVRQFLKWTLAFVVCFSFFAIPQIWHVSHKMGALVINGRQAWRLIDHNLPGKSHDEKIFGLHFSQNSINIAYAKKNYPELQRQLSLHKTSCKEHLKRFYRNFNTLYRKYLVQLFGQLGIVLSCFGILAYYRTGRRLEILFILLFMGLNVVAPLSHSNYLLRRHILIIVPIICLLEAIGILYITRELTEPYKKFAIVRQILPFIIFLALIAESIHPLIRTFTPPVYNKEYSDSELKEPIRIIQKIIKETAIEAPSIAAQRGYLSYFTDSKQVYLPFADYEALLKYCTFHRIDFLFLKHSRVKNYPFFKTFLQESLPPDFSLLYRGLDARGKGIELYRFKKRRPNEL